MDESDDDSDAAGIRHLVERVDMLVRDAESVRAHADRLLRRKPFWPDRRQPKRWDTDPREPHDDEPK